MLQERSKIFNRRLIAAGMLLFFIAVPIFAFPDPADCDLRYCSGVTGSLIGPPSAELKVDAFYTKCLDCDGIPVVGSDRVDDRAFYRLKELLDNVLVNRPDLRQVLVHEGFKCIIIAEEEHVTDVPEYADMKPKDYWNQRARGFGGNTTSCGEENLLNLPMDRYESENIFIHEFAHSIHHSGLRKCEPGFQTKLDALYKQAMKKGLYKDDYAATNPSEYWAESVQAFFDCDAENNKVHNYVNTREELIEYDPDMAALIGTVLRIPENTVWRYKRYSQELSVEHTPPLLNADGLLPKYIWCWGFPVLGTKSASDDSLLTAAEAIREIFKNRYDILKAVIDANACVIICDEDISLDDVEQTHRIIRLSADDFAKTGKSKLIGDLIRIAYQVAGMRPRDSVKQPVAVLASKQEHFMDIRFDQKARPLYDAAMQKGLWHFTPVAENRIEYIAQGAIVFFNVGSIILDGGQTIANREQLIAYDPELANLLAGVFLMSPLSS